MTFFWQFRPSRTKHHCVPLQYQGEMLSSSFFFFLPFPLAEGGPWPEIRSKHNCDLRHKVRFFNPLEEERGVKPASLAHQRATDPIALQWELQECYFLKVTLLMLRDYCCMVEQVFCQLGRFGWCILQTHNAQ